MKYKNFLTLTMLLAVSGSAIADLNTGLVAYYPFNGNANDESGNNLNGIENGTIHYVQGKIGQAIQFDGNSSYINAGNSSLFNVNHHSIAAWVNVKSPVSPVGFIVGKVNPFVHETIDLAISNNKLVTSFATDSENFHNIVSIKTISQNQWYFVAMTYDGALVKFYIDGVFDSSHHRTGIIRINTNNLAIGRHGGDINQNGDDFFFNGLIDEIRIYNRVLSVNEVKQLYKEGTNKSPTISSFTANPKAGNPPLTVNFAITANDPDGSISAYQWDFTGDGRIDDTTTTGKTSHTYSDLGTFKPNVTIVDNQGAKTKSSSIPITVQYGPDLVGEVKSYTFDNETNSISITFKVTNVGDIPARQFPVTFNLSNNGTKVLSTFKNLTVDGLAARESNTLKVDYTFDASIYGQYILILVDPKKNAAEVDETNNGTRIVVQPMVTK